MIVAFEGVDCSGKSEVAQIAAQRLGAPYYATPPEPFKSWRRVIDAHATDIEHYWFYVTAVQAASRELKELASSEPLIILDRYWMTTVAYHRAAGIDAKLVDFGPILLPDLTLYFEVGGAEQARRFENRGMSTCDKRQLHQQAPTREEYNRLLAHFRAIRIDTDTMDKQAVLDFILHTLNPVVSA
jgi:thymidylate kinase